MMEWIEWIGLGLGGNYWTDYGLAWRRRFTYRSCTGLFAWRKI